MPQSTNFTGNSSRAIRFPRYFRRLRAVLSVDMQMGFEVYLHIFYLSLMDGKRHDLAVPGLDARAATLAQDLRALVSRMKRRLREQAGVGDLTPSQTSALLRLEKHGPAATSDLARAEGMRPQSMGAVISALEQAGMVVGAPDPADGRRTILSLSEDCRKWIQEGRAARQDWLARTIHARLDAEEQDALAAALVLLKRLVED